MEVDGLLLFVGLDIDGGLKASGGMGNKVTQLLLNLLIWFRIQSELIFERISQRLTIVI